MKGMKRIFSIAAVFSTIFLLVSCEKKEKTAFVKSTEAKKYTGKTLKVAGLEGGYGLEGWKQVIADFEELTGAKVESTFAKNIEEEIRPLIQADQAPDVNYISLGRENALIETMLKEKAVMDISDVLKMKIPGEDKTVGEKLIKGFTETFTTNPYGDGKTYLMPIFYGPTGLFYNKSLFKEGGGELDLPETVDQLASLKGKVPGASVFTYPTATYFDQVFYSLINSVGGAKLFNKLMQFDSRAWKNEAKEVFEAAGKMISDLNPNTVSQANQEGFKQNQLSVMKNESLFMPNGNWIVGEMKDAESQKAAGFKWGFMAIPAFKEGAPRYAYTFTEQVWVAKSSSEAELAKAFIAYLYSDKAVKTFIEKSGQVQPVNGAVEMISDPEKKLFYSIYETDAKPALGSFVSAPAVEGINISDVLYKSIDSVANGEKTVDKWHSDVVEAVKKIENALKNN